MAYYDRLAKKWHEITGYTGGAFKKNVLNDRIIVKLPELSYRAILELGAGNGYFLPFLLKKFAGQTPARIVITDISEKLLIIAQRHFRIPEALYLRLDVRGEYPFADNTFDIILATMIYNELSTAAFRKSLKECQRILSDAGCLIMTVTHPEFVESLSRRKELRKEKNGILTMPGANGLRLPIFKRTADQYNRILSEAGFAFESESVFAADKTLYEKPGLKYAGNVPIALIFKLNKRVDQENK